MAELFGKFFAEHGERFADSVVAVLFRQTMPDVKHHLLAHVLPEWSKEGVAKCAGALSVLATNPDAWNNDLLPIRLLARHQLADAMWLRDWLEFKQKRLQERGRLATQLMSEIKNP